MLTIPTLGGCLFIFGITCLAAVLLARAWPGYLAMHSPNSRGLLIVEGWLNPDSLQQAAAAFNTGKYDAIVVSGGPIENNPCHDTYSSYAEIAAQELRRSGIPDSKLIIAPAPASAQDRTYRSAVSVRQTLASLGWKVYSVDIFSSGPHTRRSRNLYEIALGDSVQVGAIAASPSGYDLSHWWRTSAGVKEMISESVAYFWTSCCFHPGARGSWEEAWGPR